MQTLRSFLALCLLAGLGLILSTPASGADEGMLKVGEFTFKATAPWKSKDSAPRPMSQGGFSLPGAEGAKATDADFYHFGSGQGGDVEANVTRWKGQFQPAEDGTAVKFDREEWVFGKRKVTLVILQGTFLNGSPFGAKTPVPDSAMIGAILESDSGHVFVKFTGPQKQILASRDAFLKLLGTAYPDAPTKVKPAADEKAK